MSEPKAIRLTLHAERQATLRGATIEEITTTIRSAKWESALRGKFQAKKYFDFNRQSPVNQQTYRFKTIEAIFADEPNELVVITVKVYYTSKEEEL